MHPGDACSLLTLLSGVNDGEMEDEIAQALDYQPLALASASIYVREVRQSKVSVNFGWGDYLEKLVGGQRNTTETILTETNPSYQKSMTTAITLAVEKAMATTELLITCSLVLLFVHLSQYFKKSLSIKLWKWIKNLVIKSGPGQG